MVGVFYYGGCFCIPFLLEIVLYVISFLMEAKNDFYHLGIYEPEYAQKVHRYLGGALYIVSPVLYAVVMVLLFGVLLGLLGMLPVAVSQAVPVKFRMFLFLPDYLLPNATSYIQSMRRRRVSGNEFFAETRAGLDVFLMLKEEMFSLLSQYDSSTFGVTVMSRY